MDKTKKILAVLVTTGGLVLASAGIAAANPPKPPPAPAAPAPNCLVATVTALATDPVGTLVAVLSDPVPAVVGIVTCVVSLL